MNPVLELIRYKRITVGASLAMALFLSICILGAWVLNASLVPFFVGTFIGGTLASINVLSIGHAAYIILIKKGSPLNILYPSSSFFLLSLSALLLAFSYKSSLLGFACGLTIPLPLATVIVFLERNPLDRTSL